MKLRHLLFTAISIASLGSCQKGIDGIGGTTTVAAKTMLNVSYGTDPLQDMDVYLPAGRTDSTTKVIIMIHGGGWTSMDKSDFTEYVDSIKKRLPGYAIFNINYRLASGTANFFPTQENDVKAAFDFIISKTGEYQVSQKIVLLGASAGAHLALLQGYKYPSPVKAKAVVDLFGPTDITDIYNNPAPLAPAQFVAIIVGATPTTNPVIYQQSSPINFVTAQSPPTIIFQGGADQVVNPSQSTSLNAKLQTMGVLHEYYIYPTEAHGWSGANLTDTFNKIQAFILANVI
jgi:acetyl esterase/lipase